METRVTEIAPDIYWLSTYVPDADFLFNQFLIDAEDLCSSTWDCVRCSPWCRRRSNR
ncbi:hypothetical protein QMK19_26315 [Streptomyces sp. H10-C2]|uniref:hypothetical protein n=1 Tax=unclassified Streptomyces TaxID=2593676 RepID=UPI0024BAB528|nr:MULTISPECIES: hypothetical protein [unclassified Streptomyces]MDJ0344163.1 hypothetical protein [Streptomyces sp. PH10-H1]MDJ0373078.1 hypothetical protein [Streptomyces sp. H10-C2]